jgi:hypothetical protein
MGLPYPGTAERQAALEEAIAYYQAFADAGIQHVDAQSLDTGDHETFHLLAEQAAPAIRPSRNRS